MVPEQFHGLSSGSGLGVGVTCVAQAFRSQWSPVAPQVKIPSRAQAFTSRHWAKAVLSQKSFFCFQKHPRPPQGDCPTRRRPFGPRQTRIPAPPRHHVAAARRHLQAVQCSFAVLPQRRVGPQTHCPCELSGNPWKEKALQTRRLQG